MNTFFVRVVDGSGDISKVPFAFNQVPGSFTSEALRDDIIKTLSTAKVVSKNAASTIQQAFYSHKNRKRASQNTPELQFKRNKLLLKWTLNCLQV